MLVITGVDGFIGRHLSARVLATGRRVLGISRKGIGSTQPGLARAKSDLSNPDQVAGIFDNGDQEWQTATVFHLAGMSSIQESTRDPMAAFEANVRTTAVLLEGMRRAGLRRLILASSGIVYAPETGKELDESHATEPRSVYAATKLASEALVEGHALTFGFACVIARLGNVYGAGMSTDAVAGQLLDQARRKVPLSVRNTHPVRDFVYVEDVVDALLAIAEALGPPGFKTYNVSSGVGLSVGELATAVARVAGMSKRVIETSPGEEIAVQSLVLSNESLRRAVGWAPTRELDSSLAASLEQLTKSTHAS